MCVFVYSSYHLNLSFPHRVVIGCTLFAELRGRDATQKHTCQIFLPKKIPESKISSPQKSFDHPRHLESGVPPGAIRSKRRQKKKTV